MNNKSTTVTEVVDIANVYANDEMDNVNHPKHYQSKNGLEVIDCIEAFTEGLNGIEAVCAGNVIKYVCRYKSKNGLEDLKKAEWYIKKLISIYEQEE